MKEDSSNLGKIGIIATIVVVALALIVLIFLNPIYIVRAGNRGIVLKWGAVTEEILGEGIHWIMPIAKKVYKVDVTVHKVEREASAASKDLQIVTTKIAINYYLNPDKVNRIYQTLRWEWEKRVIEPSIEEFVKKTTAKYTAEELITKREIVKNDLKITLSENLSKNYIILADVFITDFDFSEQFNKAIEDKVTAEQNAMREKNKLEQKKYEAEQLVVKAKAEAESIRIQAQAITQQGGKDYVNLKAVEKWNGELPTTFLPNSTLPFINLNYGK